MKFLRYFLLSCSGFKSYRTFLDIPLRDALIYWAIFAAFLAAVVFGNFIYLFKTGFPKIQTAALYLPAFSLANGQAHSPLPQPYFSNTNQFPLILDLENTIKDPEKMFPNGMIIRKSQFSYWLEGLEPISLPWMGWPDGEINSQYLQDLGRRTINSSPLFYPIIWLIIIILGMIQAYFFTFLAGFLERQMNPGFTFNQLLNLSLFALTPPSLIIATYATIGFNQIRWDIIYFSCYCTFLVMASNACRSYLDDNSKKEDDLTQD